MSNPSSYQVLLSLRKNLPSCLTTNFFSLKQQHCERLSSQKSPQTRNSLKRESAYSRIITCDAARIFFVYILLLLSISSRDIIKSVLSLSRRCIFSSSKSLFLSLVFFNFFTRKLVVEKDPKISQGPQKTRIVQHNKIRNTHTHA